MTVLDVSINVVVNLKSSDDAVDSEDAGLNLVVLRCELKVTDEGSCPLLRGLSAQLRDGVSLLRLSLMAGIFPHG
jgi:hypothetical protein